jgi:hypothetical protein
MRGKKLPHSKKDRFHAGRFIEKHRSGTQIASFEYGLFAVT